MHLAFPTRSCRGRVLLVAAIAVAIWRVCGSAVAQPRPDVALHSSPDSVALHERFTLTISASVPAHRAVEFPAADADPSVFGDLAVLSRSPIRKQRVGAGYAIRSVTYEVKAAVPGSVRVPPLPVRVDAAVDTVVTSTLPRTIYVTSGTEASSARPYAGPAPPLTQLHFSWTWILLASITVALFGGGVYLWRTARSTSSDTTSSGAPASATDTDPTPHDVAMRKLHRLQSRDLTDPDAVESFYVALSDTLRTYLSARLDLAARERTTHEVVAVLDRRAEVPPMATEQIHAVLEQADLVKFADARPDPSLAAEALQAAQTAITTVEDAASTEPPPKRTAGTSSSDAPSQTEGKAAR